MARTLIGNIKGKDGRGITSIEKTGTTGPVDTYTITYTDDTTSTFTVNNSDSIALQRQIVPSAAVESSATASQAYTAGDYVVVNGILRKVKSSIAMGNAISDSNSTATTVTEELSPAEVTGSATATSVSGNVALDSCTWKKRDNIVFVNLTAHSTGPISAGQTVTINISGMPSDMHSTRSVGWSGTSVLVFLINKGAYMCKVMGSDIGKGINLGVEFTAYCG